MGHPESVIKLQPVAHLVHTKRSLLMAVSRPSFWLHATELALITLWAVILGWPYLDFNQLTMPMGGEFGMAIQPHFIWTLLHECGACVMWNGFVNGGNPAFVELHGVVLHPLVIITTLLWGGLNGAKVALVACFVLAGIAQWWIAKMLDLGSVARVWGSALAVSGGHLAGRMNVGVFGIILSTVACSLVLAAVLQLMLRGGRRSAIILAMMLALAIVSGQGYLQIGIMFALVPAILLYMLFAPTPAGLWKEFLLAAGLALLLAGIFLIPLIHFWPNFGKDIDPTFDSVQPAEYLPLNLVIRDTAFYITPDVLFKQPYPYLYVAYISWVPLVLVLVAMRLIPRRNLPLLLFLFAAIILVYFVSSLGTASIRASLGSTFVASVRNPSLIAGLAVPMILAIAAWGLDRLLAAPWPSIALLSSSETAQPRYKIQITGLLITLPLVWALASTYSFDRIWVRTAPEVPEIVPVLDQLRTTSTEWVEPPFGEDFWTPPALYRGMKLTMVNRPWHWNNRPLPLPQLRATRNSTDEANPEQKITVQGVVVETYPEHHYTYIDTGSERIPCQTNARGGNIDVTCSAETAGQLVVKENAWTGWYAQRDGASLGLIPDTVLRVEALAGLHQYTFRYRPWDVVIGLIVSMLGVIACISLWWRAGTRRSSQDSLIDPAPSVRPEPETEQQTE